MLRWVKFALIGTYGIWNRTSYMQEQKYSYETIYMCTSSAHRSPSLCSPRLPLFFVIGGLVPAQIRWARSISIAYCHLYDSYMNHRKDQRLMWWDGLKKLAGKEKKESLHVIHQKRLWQDF